VSLRADSTVIEVPGLTANQLALIGHHARVLWIGCGTKTGKTTALAAWIAEGILKGEPCAWVGPWHQRTRSGFEAVKAFLSIPLQRGSFVASESVCQIRARGKAKAMGGGRLDSYSGDNPEAVFGEGYRRVVIDEASRQSEKSYTAALTTISATDGRVRLAFNLERGRKNWAIGNLLRVRAATPGERQRASEDFLTFPTLGEGFVSPEVVAAMRRQMPDAVWRALYLAEIPDDDLALFRRLDEVFSGAELAAPQAGRPYRMGLDLARKADWTVATVVDDLGSVVACDRFNEISWSLQIERVAALYRRFGCYRVTVDATGVGDPIVEELRKRGLSVEPFLFTGPSKKALIERLCMACDALEIRLPATPRFAPFREEMEAFEYVMDGGEVRYGAPSGVHDDCVMSLALAVRGLRQRSTWTTDELREYVEFVASPLPSDEAEAPPSPEPAAESPVAVEPSRSPAAVAVVGDPMRHPMVLALPPQDRERLRVSGMARAWIEGRAWGLSLGGGPR
jgi:hypothetical protein